MDRTEEGNMAGGPQWFMAIGGHQVGPVTEDEIVSNIRNGSIDQSTLVFTAGMVNWTPLNDVPHLSAFARPPGTAVAASVPRVPGRHAHEIDFAIHGTEMQFVEIELDPGEAAVAEAGTLMYMTPGIEMDTIFGDGSARSSRGACSAR
jgi:hypothetical protein